MSRKGSKNIIFKSAALLALTPIIASVISNTKANATVGKIPQGIRRSASLPNLSSGSRVNSPVSRLQSKGTLLRASSTPTLGSNTGFPKYKLSTAEKILGSVGLAVGAVSVIGTAVGLGLTENQYNQTKNTYDDVVKRNYDSFYQERQEYMENLYGEWGLPTPDRYKNPMIEKPAAAKPSPGFTLGKGE